MVTRINLPYTVRRFQKDESVITLMISDRTDKVVKTFGTNIRLIGVDKHRAAAKLLLSNWEELNDTIPK